MKQELPNASAYRHFKPWPKRIRQGIFRFCIYGALLVAGEVAFYSLTKIGREIPLVKALFQYQWCVDVKLALNHIWEVPIVTFYGQASLYMFFVYGLICVIGLEPAYRFMKKKDVPLILRGLVYMFIILAMECLLGWILKWTTGYDIWYYSGWGVIFRYTSWAIAPMWFVCGLISENVINLIDSFERSKLDMYGLLAYVSGGSFQRKNRIAVLSDVHIGRRINGRGQGWFFGIYEVYLTVMLAKISMDSRVTKLILLGDFFDIWLCPSDKTPDSFADIIQNWQDAPFMVQLRRCIEHCDEVLYIPGNHDMGLTQVDLDTDILRSGGKGIKIGTPGDFAVTDLFAQDCAENGTGITKTIHLEHGNDGDLFNSPDSSDDTIQGLPFGYFVTRLAADADRSELNSRLFTAYTQAVRAAGTDFSDTQVTNAADVSAANGDKNSGAAGNSTGSDERNLFISAFVDALVLLANTKRDDEHKLTDESIIKMTSPYTDVTIGELKKAYSSLIHHADFDTMFAAAGKKGLNAYARDMFGSKDWKLWFKRLFGSSVPEKIVVMGHTHYCLKQAVMDRDVSGIYVNTGCVCKGDKQKSASWVELIHGKKGCFARCSYV